MKFPGGLCLQCNGFRSERLYKWTNLKIFVNGINLNHSAQVRAGLVSVETTEEERSDYSAIIYMQP